MEHADTPTQTQLSQGSTEMLDLDWARGLEDMQEEPSAYKVRNPHSLSNTVSFSDFY